MIIKKGTNKYYIKIILNLGILSIIGFVMLIFRIINEKSIQFAFLIWNIFLAWIPLVLSLIICYINKIYREKPKTTIYKLILGFLWLIFYPNAPYITTDVIHLSNYNYYAIHEGFYSFKSNLIMWYDLILVMLFVFIGCLLGYISLLIVHEIVVKKFKKATGWMFVFIVSSLSGFAIYLGRFLRFNSWEIISRPVDLFQDILNSLNATSIKFTMMFGMFIFIAYTIMYNLNFLKKGDL